MGKNTHHPDMENLNLFDWELAGSKTSKKPYYQCTYKMQLVVEKHNAMVQ